MRAFMLTLSGSFLAATLIASGLGHVLHVDRFGSVVRSHGLLPRAMSTSVAALVTSFELAAGGAMVVMLAGGRGGLPLVALLCASLTAGVAFHLYLTRLLRQPAPAASCGCSPLSGPLTPASLVPASGLVVASVAGLGAMLLDPLAAGHDPGAALLAACWGVTLSALVMALPAAAVPRDALGRAS